MRKLAGASVTALWLVLVVGGSVSADPSRDLETYVLFATESLSLKHGAFITEGDVGSNSEDQRSHGVSLGRRSFVADGSSVVADECHLGSSASVDDVFTNRLVARVSGSGAVTIRGAGPTAFGVPIVASLPPLPLFMPGGTPVSVPRGGSLSLPPGQYGAVVVPNGSELDLDGGGVYEFQSFKTGKEARVLVHAPATINIAGSFRLGDGSSFGPTAALGFRQVRLNVGGSLVRVSASSQATMDLYAPNANLRFGRSATGTGRFVGRRINSDHSPQFNLECGNGLVEAGEQCDDGGRVACDGCSPDCQLERCGDGFLCPAQGEQCDDGNGASCDGCSPSCQIEGCGDGITCPSLGEQCDDGNASSCDGCTDCQLETCGDGVLCAPEECDDGNATGCDGCSNCHVDTCGDGNVCPPEQCDDANGVGCDGCTACRTDTCGDGITCASEGEACDPPSGPVGCPTCTASCQLGPTCGNGVTDTACGEECDDGNATACDGCSACKLESCGDGVLCPALGEECDDGNSTICDGCTGCRLDRCGDGVTCAPEQCDDWNNTPCDGCTACRVDTCGDGVTCASEGEQCDPPVGGACSACTASCQIGARCGDGNVDATCGEECDDGNATGCDGCTACRVDSCGDGMVCPPEECDDGNATACDGCTACHTDDCGDGVTCANEGEQCDPPGPLLCSACSPTCQVGLLCGDGIVLGLCGEECDDGNGTSCDGCTACHADTCGDGVVCAPEACDDGNATNCDGCTNCQLETCGDGIVCGAEECDDGNTDPCDGCTNCRLDTCGDGVLCAPEECDDGNTDVCDGCSATCVAEFCGDGVVCANQFEECEPPDGVTCDFFCRLVAASDTFCTLSQDEWGASGGPANGPSGYVTVNPSILPVTVGALGDLSLTIQNQSSLVCFLPTSGPEAVLCTGLGSCGGDMVINACTNPPILDPNGSFTASGGQGGGVLTGEALALKLNLAISDIAAPGVPPGLRDFVLPTIGCDGICVMVNQIPQYFPIDCNIANGTRTVGDLAVMADQALRDASAFNSPPITRTNLTQALHSVNTAFDGCRTLCSPSGAFLDDDPGAVF